mmetsp:Transcript_88729/g.287295  ORF Transcript_88729/g.287295 Transcript_88729/m.287295 type:complete len:226 (-) Transcript_88729:91-768(-)
MAKNMYRTSYADMSHGREVAVRSDFPSGYGGHVPSLRHDILFRNTAFDRETSMRRNDPCRDTHPSFSEQVAGVPCATANPRGARKVPTYGTVPHDGTTTMPKPPWGTISTRREPLTHRTTPPTMKSTEVWRSHFSSPMSARSTRVNEAALNAGSIMASDTLGGGLDGTFGASHPQATPRGSTGFDRLVTPDTFSKRGVTSANEESQRSRMPPESEVFSEHAYDPA